jgi:hypothetical protein
LNETHGEDPASAYFVEGLALMNDNPFANGSVIFTQSGYYACEFARYTDGGMVGVMVRLKLYAIALKSLERYSMKKMIGD